MIKRLSKTEKLFIFVVVVGNTVAVGNMMMVRKELIRNPELLK